MTDYEMVLRNLHDTVKHKATQISDNTELTVPQVSAILNQMVKEEIAVAHKNENEAFLTYTLK